MRGEASVPSPASGTTDYQHRAACPFIFGTSSEPDFACNESDKSISTSNCVFEFQGFFSTKVAFQKTTFCVFLCAVATSRSLSRSICNSHFEIW